jgi:hypothetical protein
MKLVETRPSQYSSNDQSKPKIASPSRPAALSVATICV